MEATEVVGARVWAFVYPGEISFKFEWFGREVAPEDRSLLAQKKAPPQYSAAGPFAIQG
jgi:hypothetical protein